MEVLETTCQVILDAGTKTVIPPGLLHHESLIAALNKEFGLTVDPLADRERMARALASQEASPAAVTAFLASRQETALTLKNGFWQPDEQAGRPRGVAIETVRLDDDSCYARVSDTTDTAVALIEQIFNIVERQFGLPSIVTRIETRKYGTETKVRLKFAFEELVSPRLRAIIDGDLKEACKFSPDASVVIHPYQIHCNVCVARKATAPTSSDDWTFSIANITSADYDARVYRFYSQLPYDKHVEVITRLDSPT